MSRSRPRRRRWSTAVVTAAVVAGVAVGCGVPLDDSPRAIGGSTTTSTRPAGDATDATDPGGRSRVRLYFFEQTGNRQQLVALDVARTGTSPNRPAVERALRQLVRGAPDGYTTAIPKGTRIINVRVRNRTVFIDVTNQVDDVSANRQAFAQMVFTALAYPQYDKVAFRINGQPAQAPTDREDQAEVTVEDYTGDLRPEN